MKYLFLIMILICSFLYSCDDGQARVDESPPRPIEGMEDCTVQAAWYGGQRLYIVRCGNCINTQWRTSNGKQRNTHRTAVIQEEE